jgi:hypothetical protein
LLESSKTVEEKAAYSIVLRIVETKARSRYLGDFKKVSAAFVVTHARVARSSDVRMYGATKVRTSKIEKRFGVNSLIL